MVHRCLSFMNPRLGAEMFSISVTGEAVAVVCPSRDLLTLGSQSFFEDITWT